MSKGGGGVITLVPNWHPITLLNMDYKILTKLLAIRMKVHMQKLVNHNQTGFIQGRFIGDNLCTVEDGLCILHDEYTEGMIVALDFFKAFDSVNWNLIYKSLEWFNFGPTFTNIIITPSST